MASKATRETILLMSVPSLIVLIAGCLEVACLNAQQIHSSEFTTTDMPAIQEQISQGLRLKVAILQVTDKSLKLEYEIANLGKQPAFLLNIPIVEFTAPGKAKVDTSRCIIDTVGEQAAIAQKMALVPKGMYVEVRIVPAATMLEPGAKLKRELVVSLPLRRQGPYWRNTDNQDGSTTDKLFFFELGYFIGTRETEGVATKLQTAKGTFLYFEPLPDKSQSILRVGPFGRAVPVLTSQH